MVNNPLITGRSMFFGEELQQESFNHRRRRNGQQQTPALSSPPPSVTRNITVQQCKIQWLGLDSVYTVDCKIHSEIFECGSTAVQGVVGFECVWG